MWFDRLRQTGLMGLGRRAGRVLLERSSAQAELWSKRLMHAEAWARVPAEQRDLLSRNRTFENRHRGERAFVLANGPSLAQQNIDHLAAETTFCCNSFFRHPEVKWEATYYLVTDGVWFEDNDECKAALRDLCDRQQRAQLFAPVQYHDVIRQYDLLPESRTFYMAIDGFLRESLYPDVDLTRLVLSPPTVVQTSILAALYMGCSPIYLLGFDHNWLQDPTRFDHFHPGNTIGAERGTHVGDPLWQTYGTLTEYVNTIWRAYESVRKIAKRRNVEIINATQGGFLDLFPRCNYDALFAVEEKTDREIRSSGG